MSQSKKLIPKRRFKGFEGAQMWEKLRLGDHAIIKGRLGWKSLKQEEYVDQGPSMIAGKHITEGIINWNKVDHIPQWRYDESPEIMLKNGDIIFSKDGSLGNPALITNLNSLATINSTMMLVRLKKNISSIFFYQIMLSSQFKNLIRLKVSGSSIPHLFQADMTEFKFNTPEVNEQIQIGEFLKKLDNLINTQQKKLEKAKTLKSAYLTEMFPNEDEPKRRFIGSIGLWKQKEIIKIGKIFIGLVTTMTENYTNVGALLIRNSDIKDNKFEFSDNPIYLKEVFAQINASRRLHIGDVVTVHTGDVGTSAVITKKEENAIGFATINTRPNQNIITPEFLSVFLNSRKHKAYAKKMSTGDGRSNYNLKDFNQLIIDLPNIAEQTKIGNFFKLLDDKIALEQKKLAKLKNIKQAYLNEMFV